ncbi:MAG: GNAT family N-acetyltransferase [Caldilineaceae bacterium]|nr:GNAT family N-acetyltransferase [Caldilineaceae bacterium]
MIASDISRLSVVSVTTSAQAQEFCSLAPTLVPEQLAQGQANQHLVAYRSGRAVARCSLWWSSVPHLQGERIGCIGRYAATDRTGAAELLDAATAALAAAGCTLAVGPLDGSTFRSYRFITQRSFQGEPRPPFLLEPDNPDAWPADFIAAGFTPWSEYVSALAPLSGPDPQLERLTTALAEQGIQLRGLDPAIFNATSPDSGAFDKELARIYPLVMTAFATNPLFTPTPYVEFIAQYAPVRSFLSPELVVLAERAGELVGFLFALPDFSQAQRGEAIDTVILKTLAVLPSLAGKGLGSLLTAAVHTQAYHLGYRWAIHALMHVKNRSRRISAHTARPFRGYTLFARPLTPVLASL